jgi:DUF4097 and DUF4098 domain-containing protein YvlB
MQHRYVALLALATAAAIAPVRLAGQTGDDAEWLARCREEYTGQYRSARNHTKYCEVRELRMPATGSLTVNPGENGGVAVRGWDGKDVSVHARIQTYGEDQAAARDVASNVRVVAANGSVHAESGRSERTSWSVTFEVMVPRSYDLTLETHNGPVEVRDVSGRMSLRTVNGPIDLAGVSGDVRARAQNGPVDVALTGTRWDGAGLDAETENGPVTLRLPSGYNARLETGTVNGPMSVDFPMNVTISGRVNHRINTTLGSGGALIRVVTTNGPVEITR